MEPCEIRRIIVAMITKLRVERRSFINDKQGTGNEVGIGKMEG